MEAARRVMRNQEAQGTPQDEVGVLDRSASGGQLTVQGHAGEGAESFLAGLGQPVAPSTEALARYNAPHPTILQHQATHSHPPSWLSRWWPPVANVECCQPRLLEPCQPTPQISCFNASQAWRAAQSSPTLAPAFMSPVRPNEALIWCRDARPASSECLAYVGVGPNSRGCRASMCKANRQHLPSTQ
jgi:hypothetical protein